MRFIISFSIAVLALVATIQACDDTKLDACKTEFDDSIVAAGDNATEKCSASVVLTKCLTGEVADCPDGFNFTKYLELKTENDAFMVDNKTCNADMSMCEKMIHSCNDKLLVAKTCKTQTAFMDCYVGAYIMCPETQASINITAKLNLTAYASCSADGKCYVDYYNCLMGKTNVTCEAGTGSASCCSSTSAVMECAMETDSCKATLGYANLKTAYEDKCSGANGLTVTWLLVAVAIFLAKQF
ncbi:hypothetical protein SNE40_002101 [Patella caerulea]|uniref:Uncharacterized protein n=1 Tax=Patella caerulea TaxID=87958 RepID=A0AAN8K0G8_PATCE